MIVLLDNQTKLTHFYLIRSDLTGLQHVHPSMSTDGTWTASLVPAQPGAYRAYTSFIGKAPSGKMVPLVLSPPVTVPGAATGDTGASRFGDHPCQRLYVDAVR